MKDLVILVADLDAENAIRTLVSRRRDSLGIREVSFDIYRHMNRDSGCCTGCVDFLRPHVRAYCYSMVAFDLEGSGKESVGRAQLETDIEGLLQVNGWVNRCAVVVIDPELEAWVWSASNQVDIALGWGGRTPDLRQWLQSVTENWPPGQTKPARPKEALDAALREVRKSHSASVFETLGNRVSLRGCVDPAFQKLGSVLRRWFPPVT